MKKPYNHFMIATNSALTLAEFRERYTSDQKIEFWYGEAVPRSVGTWAHSALQTLAEGN